MKAIRSVILGLAVFTLVGSGLVFAMSCGQDMSGSDTGHNHKTQDTNPAVKSEFIDVSNKICPVMGNPIDEANKATYEYKGKIYNFCCAGCIETFKKDPEKYIKKVDEELKAESEMSDDMQSGHNHNH